MLRRPFVLVAALAALGCESTLPAASPHAFVAPAAPTTQIELCWVEFSRNDMPGSYGLAGESDDLTWDITYSGLLVRHPKGDLLIDAGGSSHFSDEIDTASFKSRILLRLYPGAGDVVATAPDALKKAGEDPARVATILLSHVHADHAGGIMDLPGAAVMLSEEELAFVKAQKDAGGFDVVRAHAVEIEKRAKPIHFEARQFATFDRSFDVFGDGTVVVVPLFGHTPGSIGTFVSRSPTSRLFHVGDASNKVEAIEKRRGKSVVMAPTDHDADQADQVVAQLTQLHAKDPGLAFIPAHDRRAWEKVFGAPGRCTR